jgi:hypothetical protein
VQWYGRATQRDSFGSRSLITKFSSSATLVERDYNRLLAKGVDFVRGPEETQYGKDAVLAYLYGNLWDLLQLCVASIEMLVYRGTAAQAGAGLMLACTFAELNR